MELFPLHVGDTWLEPPEGCRMEDLHTAEYPGLHRYPSDTRGIPPLVDALVERTRAERGIACEREGVIVTVGATLALGNALATLIDPGEEVLLLAPYWPLIRGVVHANRGTPRDVPFFDRATCAESAVELVRAHLSPRTAALYVSTPSNPTGRVIPESWLAALAELARREGLWILADEVYDELVYTGRHVSIARFAPERTITCASFSKTYGFAGCRIGYLVGPPELVAGMHRVAVHTGYNAPAPAQHAALRALEHGAQWLADARAQYAEAGAAAARTLGLPPPDGGTFLFVPVPESLSPESPSGEPPVVSFLRACLEDGIQLAPGQAFGHDYTRWVRLCFTSAPPDRVAVATARLATRLGNPRASC